MRKTSPSPRYKRYHIPIQHFLILPARSSFYSKRYLYCETESQSARSIPQQTNKISELPSLYTPLHKVALGREEAGTLLRKPKPWELIQVRLGEKLGFLIDELPIHTIDLYPVGSILFA